MSKDFTDEQLMEGQYVKITKFEFYSGARLIRMANARKNRANYLSMRIIRVDYILISDRELYPGQPFELSRRCELARVKLSWLYSIIIHTFLSTPSSELLECSFFTMLHTFLKDIFTVLCSKCAYV